jgi:hypothetical protein
LRISVDDTAAEEPNAKLIYMAACEARRAGLLASFLYAFGIVSARRMAGKPPSALRYILDHTKGAIQLSSARKNRNAALRYRFTPVRKTSTQGKRVRRLKSYRRATRFSRLMPDLGVVKSGWRSCPRIDLPAITQQHDADAEETEGGEDED